MIINHVYFWPTRDKELNNQHLCNKLHDYLHLCNIFSSVHMIIYCCKFVDTNANKFYNVETVKRTQFLVPIECLRRI